MSLQTPQPEDKLTTLIKEKIVASYVMTHETNEHEVNKRWKFEEKVSELVSLIGELCFVTGILKAFPTDSNNIFSLQHIRIR